MSTISAEQTIEDPQQWPDLMYVPEIAEYIRKHPETVREYLRAGLIRGSRAGGKSWMSRRRWVEQFVDDTAQGGGPPTRPVRVRLDKRRRAETTAAAA